MDASKPTLQQLLDELESSRRAAGVHREQHFDRMRSRCYELLHKLPLVHGLNTPEDLAPVLIRKALLSRTQRGLGPSKAEQRLAITDQVYLSAGVLYPQKDAALIFSQRAEDAAEVVASPWDSGAMSGDLCPRLPPCDTADDRRKYLQRYSLPAPCYREYLVCYVASCFGQPEDYLHRQSHQYPDPLGALDESREVSRIFEVRVRSLLPTEPKTLLAVFVPDLDGDANSHRVRSALEQLRKQSVDVKYYNGAQGTLRTRVQDWILAAMARSGSQAGSR